MKVEEKLIKTIHVRKTSDGKIVSYDDQQQSLKEVMDEIERQIMPLLLTDGNCRIDISERKLVY